MSNIVAMCVLVRHTIGEGCGVNSGRKRMRKHLVGFGLMAGGLVVCGVASSGLAAVQDDNFNDNTKGSQWKPLTDNSSLLDLQEQNQRLEMISNGPSDENTDALYLSNGPAGFRLSTASDFHITIDYSFTGYDVAGASGTGLLLDFGVGRDEDGTDSAAVAYGYTNVGGFSAPGAGVAHRTDDAQSQDAAVPFLPTTGTFDIAYNSAGDDLTLSIVGGAISYTLQDTVQAIWGASDLLVSFGGRGNGFTTSSGQAYLDNFTIVSGSVVPEPATITLLILGSAGALLRRRRDMACG